MEWQQRAHWNASESLCLLFRRLYVFPCSEWATTAQQQQWKDANMQLKNGRKMTIHSQIHALQFSIKPPKFKSPTANVTELPPDFPSGRAFEVAQMRVSTWVASVGRSWWSDSRTEKHIFKWCHFKLFWQVAMEWILGWIISNSLITPPAHPPPSPFPDKFCVILHTPGHSSRTSACLTLKSRLFD